MNWLIHNYAWVLELLGQHLVIAVSAIVVALVISIPLGRAAVNSAFGQCSWSNVCAAFTGLTYFGASHYWYPTAL